MLVITRRINELLYIGDEVQVKVLGVKGNQVRMGISAPDEITIDREEVYLKKKRNNIIRNNLTKNGFPVIPPVFK